MIVFPIVSWFVFPIIAIILIAPFFWRFFIRIGNQVKDKADEIKEEIKNG